MHNYENLRILPEGMGKTEEVGGGGGEKRRIEGSTERVREQISCSKTHCLPLQWLSIC